MALVGVARGQALNVLLHGECSISCPRWPVGAGDIQNFIVGEWKSNMYTVPLQMKRDGRDRDAGVCSEALVDGQHDTAWCGHRAWAKSLQTCRAREATEIQGVVLQHTFGLTKNIVMMGIQVGLLYKEDVRVVIRDEGLEVQDVHAQVLNVECDTSHGLGVHMVRGLVHGCVGNGGT